MGYPNIPSGYPAYVPGISFCCEGDSALVFKIKFGRESFYLCRLLCFFCRRNIIAENMAGMGGLNHSKTTMRLSEANFCE